jgi:DNA-binding IclR family transcriptional regulator
MKLNKNDEAVIGALKAAPELSMADIAEKTGVPSKKVFKSLKKLFEAEMIDSMGRKYRLLTDKVPVKAAKDEEAAEPEEE